MPTNALKGWLSGTLGEFLISAQGGGTPPRDQPAYWGGEIPWASVKDISSGSARPQETITAQGLSNSTSRIVRARTNILALRMAVGSVARYDVDVAINQDLVGLIPGPGLDEDFLFHWLSAIAGDLSAVATGTTVKGVRKDVLLGWPMLLPPLEEQRRISEVLNSVRTACAQNLLVKAQAEATRSALLHALFHRGDWESEKSCPDGWRLVLLDEVARRGSGHTPNKKISSYWRGDVQWISLQDTKRLDQVYIRETAQRITPDGIRNSSAVLHPAGTVVVSRDATIGKSAIMASDMAVSQHFIAYTCGPDLSPLYLYYWLQRMKTVFERIGAGSTIKTIGLPFFRSLRIALPPRAEQDQAALLLWEADCAIQQSATTIEKLRCLATVLRTDLLSGQVRVAEEVPRRATVQPAFKRAVFAAEVVHQLHGDSRFGAVKHEKIVHLCELHLGLQADLDRHAYKQAAGPYDPKARRSVESIFRQQKWFNATKPNGKVVYEPLENSGGHGSYYERYFGDRKAQVQSIIDLMRPMTTEQCEIVATLYAVWNDFLIEGHQPSDEDIVQSVLTNWHPSKQRIQEERWCAGLPWMRKHGLIPKGVGEKTRTTP